MPKKLSIEEYREMKIREKEEAEAKAAVQEELEALKELKKEEGVASRKIARFDSKIDELLERIKVNKELMEPDDETYERFNESLKKEIDKYQEKIEGYRNDRLIIVGDQQKIVQAIKIMEDELGLNEETE